MAALPASERGADTAPGRRGAGATSGVTGGAGGPVGRWAGGEMPLQWRPLSAMRLVCLEMAKTVTSTLYKFYHNFFKKRRKRHHGEKKFF